MIEASTLLVCGGTKYENYDLIRHRLLEITPDIVIHGVAPGADTLAQIAAIELEIDYIPYPADWTGHGRSAGMQRSSEMLRDSEPDAVLAFPGGSGTADTVRKAVKAHIPVYRGSPKLATGMVGGTVNIGRPGSFGNRFVVGREYTHNQAVEKHREWVMAPDQAEFREQVREELALKDLYCPGCRGRKTICHGQVYLELANDEPDWDEVSTLHVDRVVSDSPDSIRGRFLKFHRENPDVYTESVKIARYLRIDVGLNRVSMSLIWERLRWLHTVETKGEPFRLGNDYRSEYARLIMEQEPDLRGLFKLGKLRREQ